MHETRALFDIVRRRRLQRQNRGAVRVETDAGRYLREPLDFGPTVERRFEPDEHVEVAARAVVATRSIEERAHELCAI